MGSRTSLAILNMRSAMSSTFSESKLANKCAEKSVSALTGPFTETCASSTVLAEHLRFGLEAS